MTQSDFCFKIIRTAVMRRDCTGKIRKWENQLDGTRWWGFVLSVAEELEIDLMLISEINKICWWISMNGGKLDKKRAKKDLRFWGLVMMPLPKIGKISFPLQFNKIQIQTSW